MIQLAKGLRLFRHTVLSRMLSYRATTKSMDCRRKRTEWAIIWVGTHVVSIVSKF